MKMSDDVLTSEPSIQEQIEVLKDCLEASREAAGLVKSSGHLAAISRAKRAQSHLPATIRLLESLESASG